MYNIKTILAAASLTVLAASSAGAAPFNNGPSHNPWDDRGHRAMERHDSRDQYRRIVVRERIYDQLRAHHYRGVGTPVFVHGHYVVKSFNRRGRVVFVEVNPYTGAVLGEFRI